MLGNLLFIRVLVSEEIFEMWDLVLCNVLVWNKFLNVNVSIFVEFLGWLGINGESKR